MVRSDQTFALLPLMRRLAVLPALAIVFLMILAVQAAFTAEAVFAQDRELRASAAGKAPAGEAVELDGTLEILHEDLLNGESRVRHFLHSSDGAVHALEGVQEDADLLTGDHVRARAVKTARTLRLQAEDARSLQVLQYAPLANTFGAQKVALLLVNYESDPRRPYTVAQAQAKLDEVDAFYQENSYGQTWLDVDVFGWYTLPGSNPTCDKSLLRTQAQQAAAAAGVDLSRYSRHMYAFPLNSACAFSGIATIGGNPSSTWMNSDKPSMYTPAHELGHNFGLRHSHALRCAPGVVVGGTCTVIEYGDTTDMMGGAPAHFNAFQKQRLGWLAYGASPAITTVQASGAYTIDAYAFPGAGPKALRIPRGTSGESFYVEFRRNDQGFDAGLFRTGVFVHLANDSDPNSSRLLDMMPETASWYADTALDVGKSFTDPAAGITVTTLDADGAAATILVDLASSCTRTQPAVTASPHQGPSVAPATTVRYTIAIKNQDSAACPASSFAVQAVVPSGWTKSIGAPSVSAAPGQTVSATIDVTSAAAAAGSYTILSTATSTTASALSGSDSMTYTAVAPPDPGTTGGTGVSFTDAFDRADSPEALGNGWLAVAGTLGVKAAQATSPAVRMLHGAVQPTLQGPAQTVTAQFTSWRNQGGPRFGLYARHDGKGSYYACYRQAGGTSVLRVARVVDGIEKVLKGASVPNPTLGAPFTLTCQVTGTSITATLGSKVITVTDAALATGAPGFFMGYKPGSKPSSEQSADAFQATVQ